MLHLFAGVFAFVLVFACLVGNFTLPLRYKVQMNGKTDVNYGLYLPGRYCPAVKLSWEHTVQSHAMTSFITQNGSKAVDLASTAVTATGVFYCLKSNNGDHLILCLTTLAELKRKCVQFARKMHPQISDAKLENNHLNVVWLLNTLRRSSTACFV